jgi:hypothetical protein
VFIGVNNTDVFTSNAAAKDQARRNALAPGAYSYTVKEANLIPVRDTVFVGYSRGFEAAGLVVLEQDNCSVKIENPDPAYEYYWLADEEASAILGTGNSFQPPVSGNYYVAAVNSVNQAMSSNRKGFAVTLAQSPQVEVRTDNTLAVIDPDPGMDYYWYRDNSCENLLATGTAYAPDLGSGMYYVSAQSNVQRPAPIDPSSVPGIVLRMDASDLDGDGIEDDPAPATSSMYGWDFTNGNYWSGGSWFAFRGNFQNGLGVADFATIWLQRLEEAESGYQTFLMAYEENPISFPETAPFEGLSTNIPKHSDASQLFSAQTPATTLNGSTFLNGSMVDPLKTANPLNFCVLGVKMTAISNAEIFYTDTQWEGKLGELILWEDILTDNDILGVSEYLRRKWMSSADLESPKTGIFWEEPTAVDPVLKSSISFFPNPGSQSIELHSVGAGMSIQILGIDGRFHQQFRSHAETMMIDIQHLPSGIYLLRAIDEKGNSIYQDKLIKL